MPSFISEDQIEQALLQRLPHLHRFDVPERHTAEVEGLNDGSGRGDKRDAADRYYPRLREMNPMFAIAARKPG